MSKIFVSIPMHGMSVEELLKRMEEVEKKIREDLGDPDNELTIVSGLCKMPPLYYHKNPRLYYLGYAIAKMADCDGVYFDVGWEKSNVCLIEFEVAVQYGLTCFFAS